MIGFFPNLGVPELLLILAVALLIFGPGKLPDVGKALGKSINEFKRATSNEQKELDDTAKQSSNGESPNKENVTSKDK